MIVVFGGWALIRLMLLSLNEPLTLVRIQVSTLNSIEE